MRTFDEINADIVAASAMANTAELRTLAGELLELNTPDAEAAATNTLGVACQFAGDYSLAMDHYRRALTLYDKLGDRAGVARVSGNIGLLFQKQGEFQSALEYCRQALAVYEEIGDRIGIARVTDYLGIVQGSIGDYPAALEFFHRALAIYEELGNRMRVALTTSNIGIVFLSTGDYPAAIDNQRRALAAHEDLGNLRGMASAHSNLGMVFLSVHDLSSALEHFQKALAIHEQQGNRAGIANVTGNIGGVYAEMKEYSTALEYDRRALAEHESLGESSSVTLTLGNMITSLLLSDNDREAATLLTKQATMRMDDPVVRARHFANHATLAERAGDLDAAREHMRSALDIVAEVGRRSDAANYHQRLRDLAQKRNDFAEYIEHNNEYTRITEEIRGKEATQRMAMMEADRRMETERKERDKERALLYGTLPVSIATRMLRGEKVTGDHYDHASVIFMDIVGFTSISDKIPAGHVVHLLGQIFSTIDAVVERHGITKIKTIGDSYMAVSFGTTNSEERTANSGHARNAAVCALDMISSLDMMEITMPPTMGDTSWIKDIGRIKVRIGIHCGPVTAGVIGTQRLQYDVWGDTVNVASRMENMSEPNRIHISSNFAEALHGEEAKGPFRVVERGMVEIKGKGAMQTYWLE